MKQVLQNLKSGETDVMEIPTPRVKEGHLLIQTVSSIVSAGTERMLVDFGKANYINKARQQPEKVREVINKVKTDGINPTINAVRTKLDQPLPLGYSNAGVVMAVGENVEGFEIGDRVISNGHHAEIVNVPKNLCAKIPDNVDFDSAAFTVIGAIGLQGIRLAQPTLGERFVVMGLGLIGLITVQLLRAQGCKVLATDFDKKRLEIAENYGAEVIDLSSGVDPIKKASEFSNGYGVDGVIITAATESNEPVHQAAQMCRKRGRIVLVGVVGLELSRADFYEKELSFQVSCSYGPGRYEPNYEEKGHDYPIGFVRWTEKRNFEAILDLMSSERLNLSSLTTHRYSIDDASVAYQLLSESKEAIGIVLNYSDENMKLEDNHTINISYNKTSEKFINGKAVVGFIGAGNFTNQVLLPAVKNTNSKLKTIASSGGINGVHVGKRFGFQSSTTLPSIILEDEDINTVFITTRHNTHAELTKKALLAGKHVFVEKPLCLKNSDLEEIANIKLRPNQQLMVGFNRRFSSHIQKIKNLLRTETAPKTFIMTVNAGEIPSDHWTQDPEIGGGRIIGEACHFIDLLRYLSESEIIDHHATMIGNVPGVKIREDKVSITLAFADGSHGTIHYFANGDKSFPKERLEIFSNGRILTLNNFKTLEGFGWKDFKKMKLLNQDKGHKAEVSTFINAINNNGTAPIPIEELFEVTRVTTDIMENLRNE